MAEVHQLQIPLTEPPREAAPEGKLVALPFIDLPTVVKTMKMLRKFPDQSVLDNFNAAKPNTPS